MVWKLRKKRSNLPRPPESTETSQATKAAETTAATTSTEATSTAGTGVLLETIAVKGDWPLPAFRSAAWSVVPPLRPVTGPPLPLSRVQASFPVLRMASHRLSCRLRRSGRPHACPTKPCAKSGPASASCSLPCSPSCAHCCLAFGSLPPRRRRGSRSPPPGGSESAPNPGARVFSLSGSVCLEAAKPVAARTRRSLRLWRGWAQPAEQREITM